MSEWTCPECGRLHPVITTRAQMILCLAGKTADLEARNKELEGERDSYRQRLELAEAQVASLCGTMLRTASTLSNGGGVGHEIVRLREAAEGRGTQEQSDLAAVAPVVRAAMEQTDLIDALANDPADTEKWEAWDNAVNATQEAVRNLPADVRERMGVEQ